MKRKAEESPNETQELTRHQHTSSRRGTVTEPLTAYTQDDSFLPDGLPDGLLNFLTITPLFLSVPIIGNTPVSRLTELTLGKNARDLHGCIRRLTPRHNPCVGAHYDLAAFNDALRTTEGEAPAEAEAASIPVQELPQQEITSAPAQDVQKESKHVEKVRKHTEDGAKRHISF